MMGQAWREDFQREGQVALPGDGGSGADECVRLLPGKQVESGRSFFVAPRIKTLPVWLPVSGVLVIEPGDEAIAADQMGTTAAG